MLNRFLVAATQQTALLPLVLGGGELFQLRHQNDADQRGGEAAVVQAVAAVEVGHGGHQQVVHHSGDEAVAPAVLVGDGAQAVGVAQTHHDGLGVDCAGKIAAKQAGDPAKYKAGHHIAQHDGPNIAGMGAGIAGTQHAEDNAEGNAVEGGADQIIVAQDEQAVNAQVHQVHSVAVAAGEIGHQIGILQQLPVILGLAAQNQGEDHA